MSLQCKVCSKVLVKNQKSTCSWECRSAYVSSLNFGRPSKFKGLTNRYSEETRKKIGDVQRGKPKSEEFRKHLSEYRKTQPGFFKGKKHGPEFSELMKKVHGGERHHNWKGGITPIAVKIRASTEYAQWRKAIFDRDHYTCVICGKTGGDLNADHIKSFAAHPELRLDLNNGRTLCVPCHRATPNFGRKAVHHMERTA